MTCVCVWGGGHHLPLAPTYATQREEVFKAQVVPALVYLLERGQPEERWAACGALHALAQSEKHLTEVVSNKARAPAQAARALLPQQ